MTLRTRVAIVCLLIALPVAAVATFVVDRMRTADARLALERVVSSQINDQVKERCESDPTWFLTGPLEGRPAGGVFVETSPDDLPPRPKVTNQPFELFAYDEEFVGSSSASARFPAELRRPLRASAAPVIVPYQTSDGTGVQMAIGTGWIGSPCMYFLGRLAPPPHQMRTRVLMFLGAYALSFALALGAVWPTVARVRKLARDAHEAADDGYKTIAPDASKDELSSLTFVYNDAANELHQRRARIDDQDAALRRLVQSTDEDIVQPLSRLEAGLAALAARGAADAGDARALLLKAHDLAHDVENLTAASKLKMSSSLSTARVDLNALVARVAARHMPVADATGVSVRAPQPSGDVVIDGDEPLIECAVANLVDNAVRYNRRGGDVTVQLVPVPDERRFRVIVTDTGRGVSDDEFRGLTAVRRFRGDEHRSRRPGAPGLGLAVTREIADRSGLALDLKRPSAGGFEAELSGPIRA
ncbi:MAG TPA: sensor histidine kinase [Vicinamibacterales bacterium]|nr:sensor histidine kinase [Vicinamibacterales bacterium]